MRGQPIGGVEALVDSGDRVGCKTVVSVESCVNGANGMSTKPTVGMGCVDGANRMSSKPTVGVGGVDGSLRVGCKPVVGMESCMGGCDGVGSKPVMGVEARMGSSNPC